jgi:hypothetical protein
VLQLQLTNAQRSIIRLGILLLLFDVYLTWARIEKLSLPAPLTPVSQSTAHKTNTLTSGIHGSNEFLTNSALLQTQPLILQYLFFLLLVTASTLSFHLPIRLLCSLNPLHLPPLLRRAYKFLIPYYPHRTPISTALLVSSCTKLFPILLIIWDYDLPSSATAVSWAVIVNNVAALEILMGCGYVRAGCLVGVGAAARMLVAGFVLRFVGLGDGWDSHGLGAVWEGVRTGWGGLLGKA